MADRMIHEMIAAFAAGCMDKDNFVQFKDYMTQGGDLPRGELGELQNIISMIPVILELENPDAAIKDMVAKKLIGMKDEIKTKIIEEKKRTSATFVRTAAAKTSAFTKTSAPSSPKYNALTSTGISESKAGKKETTSTPAFQFAKDEFAAEEPSTIRQRRTRETAKTKEPKTKAPTEEPKRIETATPHEPDYLPAGKAGQTGRQPKSLFAQQQPGQVSPVPQEKVSSGIVGWIAILLVIILFTILGYYSYISMESLRRQIDDLKNEITSLRSQQSTANNFISNYASLIEFFNYKDIQVINFARLAAEGETAKQAGLDENEKASAQLLLSFTQKEGLIQFKNVKQLPSNQGYQVWMVSKGQSYSLGVYQPGGSEYLRISSFPFLPKEKIESFSITVEPNNGSASPSTNIYLTSSTAETAPRARVR